MPATIIVDGIKYPSVEHAYQAAKCDNANWKYHCANPLNKPGEIKRAGRSVKLIVGWETKKLAIMKELLIQKYTQEPYYSKLKKTGTEEIQEGNLWHDTFWGIDLRTGKGENWLGKLIMEIRDVIQNEN
jgi:ribA/ribD-fused uncharacterized protein